MQTRRETIRGYVCVRVRPSVRRCVRVSSSVVAVVYRMNSAAFVVEQAVPNRNEPNDGRTPTDDATPDRPDRRNRCSGQSDGRTNEQTRHGGRGCVR